MKYTLLVCAQELIFKKKQKNQDIHVQVKKNKELTTI